ncbi:MAG: SPASM domain-containing protein [Bacteroidia bacterium]|nr:SPASM domain-containing protein [Bacteroidia bacterium]MDW8088440.1 radical SAM/SPASM domain-containing protein [Bacteroidia bacterium]
MTVRWGWGGVLATWRMLRWSRVRQGLQSLLSYYRARWGLGWHPPAYPLFLSIEPTTACNLRCPLCLSGTRGFTRPKGTLDPELLAQLLQELHPYLWGVLFYFQGEPLLHPALPQLISYASRYRLLTSLSTNGHLLTEERCYQLILAGLTHIRISLDGMTPTSYAQYRRGGHLEEVLVGIARLLSLRQALRSLFPLVEVQFIVFRHNLAEIEAFRRWAKSHPIDRIRLKTAHLPELTPAAYAEWIPPEFSRYAPDATGHPRLRKPPPNRCWRLWRATEITWDGRVVPCCFDKDARYMFGQLGKRGFTSIWRGPQAEAFRRQVFQNRESIDICQNCTEGIRPWA